jgi:hypothetical protein
MLTFSLHSILSYFILFGSEHKEHLSYIFITSVHMTMLLCVLKGTFSNWLLSKALFGDFTAITCTT